MKPFYGGKIMKNLIIVAITAASLVAVAQTSTTAPTAPAAAPTMEAQPPAMEAQPVVKKAKKAKKAKPSAQVAPAVAPVVTTDQLPATVQGSALTPGITKEQNPAAAGTSTTSAGDAVPVKSWKGSVSVTPSQNQTDAQEMQTLSKIGLSYKVTPKVTVKAAQTFESLNAGKNLDLEQRTYIDRSNFRSAWTDITLSTTGKGILGSNDLPISLNVRKVTGDAVISQLGAYGAVDALIDLNVSIPYTLSPRFDLSIDTQIRHAMRDVASESGHRLLAVPTLSYNVNDVISVYQGAGMMFSLKDNGAFRRNYERLSLSTGVAITASKSLSFDLNVSQDKAVYVNPGAAQQVTGFTPYQSTPADGATQAEIAKRTFDDVAYEATVAYSF